MEKKDPGGTIKFSVIVIEHVDTTNHAKSPKPWLSFNIARFTVADLITFGDELSDMHIAFVQAILKFHHRAIRSTVTSYAAQAEFFSDGIECFADSALQRKPLDCHHNQKVCTEKHA